MLWYHADNGLVMSFMLRHHAGVPDRFWLQPFQPKPTGLRGRGGAHAQPIWSCRITCTAARGWGWGGGDEQLVQPAGACVHAGWGGAVLAVDRA